MLDRVHTLAPCATLAGAPAVEGAKRRIEQIMRAPEELDDASAALAPAAAGAAEGAEGEGGVAEQLRIPRQQAGRMAWKRRPTRPAAGVLHAHMLPRCGVRWGG